MDQMQSGSEREAADESRPASLADDGRPRPPRIVLVTPRYWPMCGSTEIILGDWAAELVQRGCAMTVLTARWHPTWPAAINVRGAQVVRLPHAPQHGWATARFVRTVSRWLRGNFGGYDLVCVSGLGYEAFAAVSAAGRRFPVVIRAERCGTDGDCRSVAQSRFGGVVRRRCGRAAALVAPNQQTAEELREFGYPERLIRPIANGVPTAPAVTARTRGIARLSLAESQSSLQLPERARLAVCAERLATNSGLPALIAAWRHVIDRWSSARLWLVGNGPDRMEVQRLIDEAGLSGHALLVGTFDCLDELVHAADLVLSDTAAPSASACVLRAMMAGVPVAAWDWPDGRQLLDHGRRGLLAPSHDAAAMAVQIDRLLSNPTLSATLAAAAREYAVAEHSVTRMADQHLTLFHSLK